MGYLKVVLCKGGMIRALLSSVMERGFVRVIVVVLWEERGKKEF